MKKWLLFLITLGCIGINPSSILGQQNISKSPSALRSTVQLERTSAPANGTSSVLLTGSIKNSYQEPLVNIQVKVLSNRGGIDTIVTKATTDRLGRFTSRLSSKKAGTSILSIFAGETQLYEKPTIVFYENSRRKNVGSGGFGQFLQASLFGNSSRAQTEYLVIEDLGSPLTINDKFSVKVVAKDASGNIDPNYRGTIRFSVPGDPNAKPPGDYTFTEADQGSHDFYLAVSFGTIGRHKFVVQNIDDVRISGEMEIDVIPKQGGGNVDINPEGNGNLQTGTIEVNVPTDGSSFSASRITLSGNAPGIQNLQLFDGPTLVSNNVPVNADGTFAYQTPQLADGLHQFQFFSNDGSTTEFKSDKINITIDQTPPSVLKVDLIPTNEAEPGEEITVMVGSSEDLSTVEGIFSGTPMIFERINERTFRAFVTAPNNGGAYPISVSAADLLGNIKNEPNAEVLYVKLPQVFTPTVSAQPETPVNQYNSLNTNPRPINTNLVEPIKNIPPTAIVNLSAVPGDGKVTLFWSPATDDKGIKHYQINYGSPPNLTNANNTPDARTQWYIEGLTPCEKIKFSVTPIDNDNEAGQASNMIESAAKCTTPNTTAPPKSGGPNWFSLLLGMIFGGICILFARIKKS